MLSCLDEVVSGRLTGEALRRAEDEQRLFASESAGTSEGGNAHTFKLASKHFRRRAVSALRTTYPNHHIADTSTRAAAAAPFHLDAILHAPEYDGYTGVKLFTALRAIADPERVSGTVFVALAAARVFDQVLIIVQRDADAVALKTALEKFGRSGVGVIDLDQSGSMLVRFAAQRDQKPDLVGFVKEVTLTRFAHAVD